MEDELIEFYDPDDDGMEWGKKKQKKKRRVPSVREGGTVEGPKGAKYDWRFKKPGRKETPEERFANR